jgi:1-acyl-sn-glycerol-3-phosphate acyltransferase
MSLLRGILFHVGVLVVTLPFVAMINTAILLLLVDHFAFGRGKKPQQQQQQHSILRRLFHMNATLGFANWSICVGRLLVWCYGMRCHASTITPRANRAGVDVIAKRFFAAPPPGKVTVIMMNHRTVLDWMFLWAVIAECGGSDLHYALKIVPKAALSKLPMFGWCMQAFRFLFLSRSSTEGDLATIRAAARCYVAEPNSADHGVAVLLFPEGTDLSKVHLEKSHAFCKKEGLPLWNYVLAPRALGLGAMLQGIGKGALHEVLDVTLGYEDFVLGERAGESSLIKGRAPRAMHVALRKFRTAAPAARGSDDADDDDAFVLPDEIFTEKLDPQTVASSALNTFVRGVFAEKEQMLQPFYERQHEQGTTDGAEIRCPPSLVQRGWSWSPTVQLAVGGLASVLFTRNGIERVVVPFALVLVPWAWAVLFATAAQLQLVFVFMFSPFLFARYVIMKRPLQEYFFAAYG